MKLLILSLLLMILIPAYAQRAKVLIVDPDVETKDLEQDYEVQRPRQPYALPNKEIRDEVFAGIESVKKYDELKKDILYMDLQSKTLPELKKKYPDISQDEFKIMMDRK